MFTSASKYGSLLCQFGASVNSANRDLHVAMKDVFVKFVMAGYEDGTIARDVVALSAEQMQKLVSGNGSDEDPGCARTVLSVTLKRWEDLHLEGDKQALRQTAAPEGTSHP